MSISVRGSGACVGQQVLRGDGVPVLGFLALFAPHVRIHDYKLLSPRTAGPTPHWETCPCYQTRTQSTSMSAG